MRWKSRQKRKQTVEESQHKQTNYLNIFDYMSMGENLVSWQKENKIHCTENISILFFCKFQFFVNLQKKIAGNTIWCQINKCNWKGKIWWVPKKHSTTNQIISQQQANSIHPIPSLTNAHIAAIAPVEAGGTNARECPVQVQALGVEFRANGVPVAGTFVDVFFCFVNWQFWLIFFY